MRFNYKNLQPTLIGLMIGAASLLLPASLAMGQDCKKLPDGTYQVKFKTNGYEKSAFTLVITGDNYVLTRKDNTQETGKIQWWHCMFGLTPDVRSDSLKTDSYTPFQQHFLSPECFELTPGKSKFRLTYCANLHITLSTGTIRRVTKK